jgi:hypothetical protein
MYIDFPQHGDGMKTMHKIQGSPIVDDVVRNLPQIYASLDNRQANHQSNIVKVEGKIAKKPLSLLLD